MFLQQQLTMTAMIIPARKDNLLSISTKYGIKRRSQKNFNLTLNHAKLLIQVTITQYAFPVKGMSKVFNAVKGKVIRH